MSLTIFIFLSSFPSAGAFYGRGSDRTILQSRFPNDILLFWSLPFSLLICQWNPVRTILPIDEAEYFRRFLVIRRRIVYAANCYSLRAVVSRILSRIGNQMVKLFDHFSPLHGGLYARTTMWATMKFVTDFVPNFVDVCRVACRSSRELFFRKSRPTEGLALIRRFAHLWFWWTIFEGWSYLLELHGAWSFAILCRFYFLIRAPS